MAHYCHSHAATRSRNLEDKWANPRHREKFDQHIEDFSFFLASATLLIQKLLIGLNALGSVASRVRKFLEATLRSVPIIIPAPPTIAAGAVKVPPPPNAGCM